MTIDLRKLREIGWSRWNPIGIAGPPETPADEYDRYLFEAACRIERNESLRDVAAYLVDVERNEMGLSGGAAAEVRAYATVQAINERLRSPIGEIVKRIMSRDLTRRVCICKRPDGFFRYRDDELRFFDDAPPTWLDGAPSGIFATVEEAENEARRQISWLRSQQE